MIFCYCSSNSTFFETTLIFLHISGSIIGCLRNRANHCAIAIWWSWLDYGRQIIGYVGSHVERGIEASPFASLLGNLYLPGLFASVVARAFSAQASPPRPMRIRQRWETGLGIDCCIDFAFPESASWTTLHRQCCCCYVPKAATKANEVSRWTDCIPRRAVARAAGYFEVSYWKSLTTPWFYSISFY